MSEHIDQFCENLRIKLTNIDNNMESLKSKIDSKARTAEQDVRRHLDGVKKRIEQDRGDVAAAQADIKKWIEERKATASEKVAELNAKRETAQLQNRANSAERYAAGAAVVALAAIDEAERASLEAWLARKDAEKRQPSPSRSLSLFLRGPLESADRAALHQLVQPAGQKFGTSGQKVAPRDMQVWSITSTYGGMS